MEGRFAFVLILFTICAKTFAFPYTQFSGTSQFRPYQQFASSLASSYYPQSQSAYNYASPSHPSCVCYGRGTCPSCTIARQQSQLQIQTPTETDEEYQSRALNYGPPVERHARSVPASPPSAENEDSSFMGDVRSALLALEPLFGDAHLQVLREPKSVESEIPTRNSLAAPKMQQLDKGPAQTYGLYYSNVRVQSFNANPDEGGSETGERSRESKERKIDEQHGRIMTALEQLSQGQIAQMVTQLDAEMMTEQEFYLLESNLREIKRQLKLLRLAAEAKDRTTTPISVTSDSQSETTTAVSDDVPDTTTATELESTARTKTPSA